MDNPRTSEINEQNRVSLDVVVERISNIDRNVTRIDANLVKLEARIDNAYATKAELSDTQRVVDKLEDNQKWLVRLVMGAIVTAILGLIGLNLI